MRNARRSNTAVEGLQTLLAQGLPKFGLSVIVEKQGLVDHAIEHYLTRRPSGGSRLQGSSYYRYDVSGTPFAVVYTFDDEKLDVHFIIHKHQDTRRLNPSDVEW